MKLSLSFLFLIFFVFLSFCDTTGDAAKNQILYNKNPDIFFDKVIQNPENYKNDIEFIINVGMNIANSKNIGNRQPLYKSLVKLYNYMSEEEKNSARDMCIYLTDYEYRNFNDLSSAELIVLLSMLGNSSAGKLKINASEVLKKFILHPSIQNLNARHSIGAIIYSFKKFYYDTDATEYITKIYEFSGKWSIQDQRRLKP